MQETSEAREARWLRWRSWLVAAQAGDADAYERLLRELLPHLGGFVARRVFDPSSAEDIVQDVLLSLHRARHTFRPEQPLRPWLHAIARNAITDRLRARARRLGRELPLDAPGVPEPAVAGVEPGGASLPRDLAEALASLPPSQRQAVELLHVQELSVQEAARRAGVSRGALKVRAHRGARALRARLELALAAAGASDD